MKSLRFATTIHAPRKAVWDAMLAPDTYRIWTAPFMEGSQYEGSWEKGARIRFLGPDGSGMASVIEESRPHEFLSIRHLGFVKDGVEDLESEAVKGWAGCHENYSFSDAGTSTQVTVDLDVTPEFEDYMVKTWPRALSALKGICEPGAAAPPVPPAPAG